MDELDTWLGTSIGAEPLRAEVRQACGGPRRFALVRARGSENELPLSTWPPLERQRFLSAWRGLRGENDVDEAAATTHRLTTPRPTLDEDEPAEAPQSRGEPSRRRRRRHQRARRRRPYPTAEGPRYQVGDPSRGEVEGRGAVLPCAGPGRPRGRQRRPPLHGRRHGEPRAPLAAATTLAAAGPGAASAAAARAGCGVLRRGVGACAGQPAPCFADGGGAVRRRVGARGAAG